MVGAVTESLDNAVSNGRKTDPFLTALFQSYGFDSVDKASLRAMQVLLDKVTKYHKTLVKHPNHYYRGLNHDPELDTDIREAR
jgi:hypothetical protein